MRKLPALALFTGASALAASALGAAPKTHRMDVPLPDGSVAQIEYVGDVAPKVTIAPRPIGVSAPSAMPGLGRIFEDMNRRTQDIVAQAQQMARQPAVPGAPMPYVASVSGMPGAASSTTVVSVSNGGGTCTRTTQVVSDGAGKPPKVTTSLSGQCGAEAPRAPGQPLSRT